MSDRRRILAVTGAAHGLTHMAEDALAAPLKSVGAEFDLADSTLGWIGTLHGGVFGFMALPAGLLAMAGYSRALVVGAMAVTAAAGFLTFGASGAVLFVIGLTAVGFGAGYYHAPGLTVVSTITERRGRALAFHGICGNLGIACAPLMGWLVLTDWRLAFVVLGVACAGVAVWSLSLPRGLGSARQAAAPAAKPDTSETPEDGGPIWLPFGAVIALLFLGGFVLKAVKLFLNKNVELSIGDAEGAAGLAGTLISGAYLMGAFGQVIGGRLLDRIGADRVFAGALFLAAGACGCMAWTPGTWVVAPAGAFAFFYFMGQPASNELIARFIGPRWRGLGFGIHFSVSFGLGSLGGSWAGGYSAGGRMAEMFAWCGVILATAAAGSLGLRVVSGRARNALLAAGR
jgi:MFS family permease